jgi:hypothetical protein
MSIKKSDSSHANPGVEEPDTCGICYQPFTNTHAQSVCDIPGHYFHNECLDRYYSMRPENEDSQRPRCPLCQNVNNSITSDIRKTIRQGRYDDSRRINLFNQYPFTIETIPLGNGELLTQQELFRRFRGKNPPPSGSIIHIYEYKYSGDLQEPRYRKTMEIVTNDNSYSPASEGDESGNFFQAQIGNDIIEMRNDRNMYVLIPPIRKSWLSMPFSILGKRGEEREREGKRREGGKTKRKRRKNQKKTQRLKRKRKRKTRK